MSEHSSEQGGLSVPVEPTEVWAADELDAQLVRRLADRARSEGLALTGAGSLLQQLAKLVLEAALEGEIDDHLGYAKHAVEGRDGGNSRNGRRAKTVATEVGHLSVAGPRGRDGQVPQQFPTGGFEVCSSNAAWSQPAAAGPCRVRVSASKALGLRHLRTRR